MSKRDLYQVLRHQITTEKSTMLGESGFYTFKVLKDATKEQIKKAVELAFNVKVKEVKTLIVKGKAKIFKGRIGQRSDYKKALVRLESGEKLDLNFGA
jgi:large subunit ribosomal protein L23